MPRSPICLLAAFLVMAPAAAADFDLWFGVTGAPRDALLAECGAFNAGQTSDHITCSGLGDYETVLQRTAAAYRAGKQPALVQIFDAATSDMLASGATVPLPAALSRRAADYPDLVRQFYSDARGALLALPFNVSTLLLYVNDDKLSAAGVVAPADWVEFDRATARLRQAGEACPFAFRLDAWWWLDQAGAVAGEPVASRDNGFAGLDARYLFRQTSHRRMMGDLLRWYQNGQAILFDNSSVGSPQRAFAAGDCAMVLESSGTAGGFAAAGHFRMSAHPLPVYPGRPRQGSAPGGGALWVMRGFTNDIYRAVDAFLDFVSAPRRQADFARATGYLPLSPAAQQIFTASNPPALQQEAIRQAIASLDLGGDGPAGVRLGGTVRFRRLWTEEMQRAFAGEISLDQALLNAQRRGDANLRRFERIFGEAG